MKEWLIDFWEDFGKVILTVFGIVLCVILFIFALMLPMRITITVYDFDKSEDEWHVIYEKHSWTSSYIQDEIFITREGALDFIRDNDKKFYGTLNE